jgi:NAD(P)-dependent dehydrogenase (short-subunit alcohol dehydrogenase family)
MPASGAGTAENSMLSLITGVGAKGQVGEAVAVALARRGDTVLLVARSDAEVRERTAEVVASGGTAHGYACDLSDVGAVDELAQTIRGAHGDKLDALVNLAGGFSASGPIGESDPAMLEKMLTINAKTAYVATRALYPMLLAASGSIVYVASEVVIEGARSSGVSAYAMAKTAVVALMRSVADEGREHGVRANALAPTAIRTAANEASMGPKTRYIEREEVAAVIAFLTSSDARAVSGQVIRLR